MTTLSGAAQNLVTAVNKAGVHVDDTIFEPCWLALIPCSRSDERELGVCLADLGAGKLRSGSCFSRARLRIPPSFPLAATISTSDLSVGMTTGLRRRRNAEEDFRQRRADADPGRQ